MNFQVVVFWTVKVQNVECSYSGQD